MIAWEPHEKLKPFDWPTFLAWLVALAFCAFAWGVLLTVSSHWTQFTLANLRHWLR